MWTVVSLFAERIMLNQQGKVFMVLSSRGKFAVHRALGIWREVALNREQVNVFYLQEPGA